jgi:serine protease Do
MIRRAVPLIGLAALVGFLLGLVASGPDRSARRDVLAVPATTAAPVVVTAAHTPPSAPVVAGPVDFAEVAARLNGAVVNVDTTAREPQPRSRLVFPRRVPDDVHEGSGSGFVIDPAGYILTNYHVVNDADRVMVTLGDGRIFKAEVVGVDADIDVALLQVKAGTPLAAAPLGTSSALRVGEWVCAIGNPLGYPHSVTVGVVSFLGRKVFDPSLDALIQTDAGITFGNSGGPLINARGEVVGITAAISSQAANIGFAVPIDQVVAVLPQLREIGRVARGHLGVTVANLTPELHRALRLGPAQGAVVQDVTTDSPADRAGLRPYDVILRAGDHQIRSDDELVRYISGHQPGAVTTLEVWRDGAARSLSIRLAERPASPSARALGRDAARVQPASRDDLVLGLRVVDLDDATIRRRAIPASITGVLIAAVESAGPSRATAVRDGQILLEINRQRISSAAEYRAVVAAIPPGTPVALYVYDPATRQRVLYAFVTDPS